MMLIKWTCLVEKETSFWLNCRNTFFHLLSTDLNQTFQSEKYLDLGLGSPSKGHTTFNATTFGIMALSIMTLSIMTLSIMTLSIMTLSIMTLSMMTLRIMDLISTLIIMTHNFMTLSPLALRVIMLSVNMPSAAFSYCNAECRYNEYRKMPWHWA